MKFPNLIQLKWQVPRRGEHRFLTACGSAAALQCYLVVTATETRNRDWKTSSHCGRSLSLGTTSNGSSCIRSGTSPSAPLRSVRHTIMPHNRQAGCLLSRLWYCVFLKIWSNPCNTKKTHFLNVSISTSIMLMASRRMHSELWETSVVLYLVNCLQILRKLKYITFSFRF